MGNRQHRKKRERAENERAVIGFGTQSATSVPRPQRRIRLGFTAVMWAAGRALRGFSTTARAAGATRLVTVGVAAVAWLGQPSLARAQSPGPEQRVASPVAATSAANTKGWSRRLARSHFERALALEQRGDIADALREYTLCIAIDSTLGDAYLRLG